MKAFAVVRRMQPHKLVFVGFSRWKTSSDFGLIEQLGLNDSVTFTGFIPDEDIPAMYNLAEALVYPSLYEGFGIPVLEAMACGCPVVTTKTGCTPEVAGDAAVLVDPLDCDEIADAICTVLTDSALWEELITKGFKRAAEFDWKRCAQETIALLESVAVGQRVIPSAAAAAAVGMETERGQQP